MWNELDLIDLVTLTPVQETSPGPVIEEIIRNALIWHPGSQAWHLGAAADYRAGYANTSYTAIGAGGEIDSNVSVWWHGFGFSAFYGHKF